MTVRLPENLNLKPFALVVTLAVLFVAVLATYESRNLDWPPYVEEPPELSTYGQLRSLTIFLLSGVILWGLRRTGVGRRHLQSARHPAGWVDLGAAGLALAFIAVFVFSPELFNQMALEDGPVEWASFAALILSSAVLVYLCCSLWSVVRPAALLALALGAGCFVIAMEEVSWLQRQLGFDTPAFLSRNYQNEANFHNLSTDIIENIYYLGAFVFLIGLSYLCEAWRLVPFSCRGAESCCSPPPWSASTMTCGT